jgi:hypothetical protein
MSTYVELQPENNEDPSPPEAAPQPRRTVSSRKVCCIISFAVFVVSLVLFVILSPYSDSVKCPDCVTFCDPCDCAITNGTDAQKTVCEKCASCISGECSNFSYRVSGSFATIFWWTCMISLVIMLCNCAAEGDR